MDNFEWDKKKQEANLEKHGIDFFDAIFIFDDPNRIEAEIVRAHEKRYVTIGQINQIEILVVYTRRGMKKRLISARRASRHERKAYEAAKIAE